MFLEKIIMITLVILAFTLAGCAGTAARTEELLQKNHQTMTDQELLTYYYRLNDQIAREEREARGTSVGVGLGSGPVRVGVSQGVSRGVIAEDLRDRRNEVRAELTERGLRP